MTIIEEAQARADARPRASMIDYARMSRVHPRQKAALTRAVNAWRKLDYRTAATRDEAGRDIAAENIARVCKAAVAEWNAIGAWPDDWHRWNIALTDALGWNSGITLDDL